MNLLHLKKKEPKIVAGTLPVPQEHLMHKLSSDPFLDWILALILGLIFVIALAGLGLSVYLGTSSSLTVPVVPSGKTPMPISEIALDKVLAEFDDFGAERQRILTSYSAPRDPSLP